MFFQAYCPLNFKFLSNYFDITYLLSNLHAVFQD